MLAGKGDDLAARTDDFEGRNGAGKVAVFFARAVRGGAARTGNGNVRQGSKVGEGEAFAVKIRSELAIGHPAGDGYRACCGVECYDVVHVLQRKELLFAVGDRVEAVTRSEDFEFGLLLDEILNLLEGGNVEELFSAR